MAQKVHKLMTALSLVQGDFEVIFEDEKIDLRSGFESLEITTLTLEKTRD